ncbi:hypothetical protein BDP27DRAFT_1220596, partial [Rhodocollybia butyracea]
LLLYDWMLMFPLELEVIWSDKLRPLNVLYVIQRYMPFVDIVAFTFAGRMIWPDLSLPGTGMYTTGIALTEGNRRIVSHISDLLEATIVILTLRTWALWEKDIRLTIGLPIFFVVCQVPIFYIIHLFLSVQTYIPSPVPQIGCVPLGGESMLYLDWVILMVYEAVILTLMLIPAFAYFRSGNWSALTTVVYRDGITYYLFLFGFSVTNVVAVLLLPVSPFIFRLVTSAHPLAQSDFLVFFPPQRVMHTLLTSRVILHIRSQLRKPQLILLRDVSDPAISLSHGTIPPLSGDSTEV